jgi:prepilin-type N-terminal cleavage/methylation domain-containing protein
MSKGFTLIELIIAIVVVAIAAVAIGSAFAYMSRSQVLSTDLQRASQIAQECAEHIVGRGRKPNTYGQVAPVALNSTICDTLPAPGGGFARTVNIRDQASAGVTGAVCTAGWSCKHVQVIAGRGSAQLTVNFMLVNY